MAKVMEDKVLEVDLDNLTKEDFMQMAHYIQHLEEQLEGAKTTGIALVGQRNVLQKKVEQLTFMLQRGVRETPVNTVMDTDYDLVNPEQYREKKQIG
jgi:CBS-domain-containing membrane protein